VPGGGSVPCFLSRDVAYTRRAAQTSMETALEAKAFATQTAFQVADRTIQLLPPTVSQSAVQWKSSFEIFGFL